MKGRTARGKSVEVKDLPVVSYFKRSGFRPAREAIEKIAKGTAIFEQVFELTTKRHKMGSVTYFTPIFTPTKTVKMTEDDFQLSGMFLQTIAASNHRILEEHKEARKQIASTMEVDLAADFK